MTTAAHRVKTQSFFVTQLKSFCLHSNLTWLTNDPTSYSLSSNMIGYLKCSRAKVFVFVFCFLWKCSKVSKVNVKVYRNKNSAQVGGVGLCKAKQVWLAPVPRQYNPTPTGIFQEDGSPEVSILLQNTCGEVLIDAVKSSPWGSGWNLFHWSHSHHDPTTPESNLHLN